MSLVKLKWPSFLSSTSRATASSENLSLARGRSFQDPARIIHQQHDRHQQHLLLSASLKNVSGSEASEPLISRPSPSNKQMSTASETRGRFSGSPSRRDASSTAIMDLSFVTERILALSFPPEIESNVYRDALNQAANMLQTKHGDNYMVFNLSLPRKEIGYCNPRVLDVGWPSQLAPPLERLCSVCRALDSWLQADPQHVAVLHSRSGLQRVGVVVAAYCEYTGLSCPPNQDQSLDRFSMKRFLNERVGGLRSPSDKRYVEYFAGLLSGSIQVNSSPLFLDHLTVVGIPAFQSNGGCRAFFKVYQGSVPVHTSSIYNLHDSARHFTVPMGERGLALRGDILVKCYHRHRQSSKEGRETVFSLQFHTCAVTQHTLVFQRQDLDDACQDLRFPLDGSVRLHFSTGSESRLGVSETHTRYTVESSTGDAVVRWDSYDTVADSCSEHHDVSSAATLSARHRLAHIYGPLDGSLYAKVLKSSIVKTPPNSPPLIAELDQQLKDSPIEPRSVSRFSDPNSTSSGGGDGGGSGGGDHYHHHHQHHHHHHRLPSQFLNSPHVASTDSGISSAGVVRSAGGSSGNHRGDLGSAGSTSASPPHSGHSAESSAAVFDSPSTPSPVQQQQHQSFLQLRKMPSIVETRAEVHHDHHAMKPNGTGEGGGVSPASPTLTATAELDQLLSGMLMNVQNIPDIRPSQRHFQLGDDIDVDSIQVKFDLAAPAPVRDTTDSSCRKNSNPSLGYVYESDTVRRATHQPLLPPPATNTNSASEMINLFNSSASGGAQSTGPLKSHISSQQPSTRTAKDIPYHAREDSKPFTYGMVSNGAAAHRQDNGSVGNSANGVAAPVASPTPTTEMAPISPPTQRRNWKESSSSSGGGGGGRVDQAKAKALESPSLVRKFSTGSEPSGLTSSNNTSRSAPRIPPPSIAEPTSPRPMRKLSEAMLLNGSSGTPSNILPVATSSPRLDSTRTRSASANSDFSQAKSPHALSTTPQLQHYISLEESIQDISTSPDSSRMSNEMVGLSWLQRQQQKLRDRKDSLRRAERHPQEARLLSELRLSHQFKGQQQLQQQQQQQQSRPGDDGYLSDVTLFSELDMVNTSREGSPDIRSLYATPLHINTANSYGQQYQQSKFGNVGGGYNRTLSSSSNPGSPLLTHRSSSTERSVRYPGSESQQQQQRQQQQQEQQSRMVLTRQKSDISYDRERPFVAVKRAHEQLKTLTNGRQTPNHLLAVAGLSYSSHHSSSPLSTTPESRVSSTSTKMPGLLSTVSDNGLITTSSTPTMTIDAATSGTAVSRIGNLDRLINTLNTNLPDPTILLRQPNLTPNQVVKQMTNGNSFSTLPDRPQQVTLPTLQASTAFHNPNQASSLSRNLPAPTATRSNNKVSDSVMSWNSSLSGEDLSNRPVTPGFPVVPRTPYLNVQNSGRQSVDSVSPTSSHSTGGTGLPPKSPTTQRRNQAGLQTNSFSPTPSSAKILRKWPSNSSVSSKERSPSPSPSSAYLGQSQSRRSSIQSVGGLSDPQEVSAVHVNFVKDTSRFWYKPNIARENAIAMLKDQCPGTFIVRDSNSFPGAFGLALKVATPPPHAAGKNTADPSAELVRHFLIEPTSKGVRIKGCSNEPVFGSLSALIYQHSVTPLALPTKLVLPDGDMMSMSPVNGTLNTNPTIQLLTQGAACNLLYLFTMDTESLTGPQAIQRSMTHLLDAKPLPSPTVVHFKVSSLGITLTDNERKLFFRRHYPVSTVSYCGLDPEDRRWNQRSEETGLPISSNRCFGFIARKPASKTDNQCHLFAELEAEQPATAIVNFVKLMMTSSTTTHNKNNV